MTKSENFQKINCTKLNFLVYRKMLVIQFPYLKNLLKTFHANFFTYGTA